MVAQAPFGERSVIAGKIVKAQEARARRRRLEVLVRDEAGGTLVCIWFHYRPSFLHRFPLHAQVLVSGEVRQGYRGGGKVMHHPDVELLSAAGGTAGMRGRRFFRRRVPGFHDHRRPPPATVRPPSKRPRRGYSRFVEELLPGA